MRFPSFDSHSLSLVIIGAVATAVVAVYSITGPEPRRGAFLLVLFGLVGTYRRYQLWRRTRGQQLERPPALKR